MAVLEHELIERIKIVTNKTNVSMDSRLVDNLEVDSLSFIRLVVDLETNLKIRFDDSDLLLDLYPTVSDLHEYFIKQTL